MVSRHNETRPSAHVHMCESSSLSVHGVALDVSRLRDPSVEEVAAMLLEAAPHLLPSHADAISGEAPSREASRGSSAPHTPPQSLAGSFASRTRGSADASSRGARLKSRLDACVAADVTQPLDWSELSSVVRSEDLAPCAEEDASTICNATRAVDVNSGGAVFFCVFGAAPSARDGSRRGHEKAEIEKSSSVAVVKFCADRLACVSEHFAGALAGALGVATPACRLARRDDPPRDVSTKNVSTKNEWFAALDAARRLCSCSLCSCSSFETDVLDVVTKDVTKDANACCSVRAFAACLEKHECALAQRFVVGAPFFASPPRRSPPLPRRARGDLAEALGRVFVLDCLLGNADRLPCAEMGWRGNAGNLLLASKNETETENETENDGGAFFLCAIDQSVARRVPRRRALEDAAAVPRVLELVRNRPSVARRVFAELCGGLDGLERAGFVESTMSNQSKKERDERDEEATKTELSAATKTEQRLGGVGATRDDPNRVDPDDDALWPADVRLATRRFVCGTVAAVDKCGSLASVFATTTEALRVTLAALFDDLDARNGNPEEPAREASAETKSPPKNVFARARVPQKAFFAAFPGDEERRTKDDSRDESTDASSSKKTRSRSPSAENAAGFSASDPCVSPPTLPIAERGTMRLRSVQRDARASSEVDEWLRSWSTLARREKAKLRSMLADWSARRLRARRGSEAPEEETPDATGSATSNARTRTDFECAFLDVTEQQRTSGRDVVDLYELWARVSRLSERALRVFETASTRRPSKIAPGIFLGGALEANAKHTLLSLGITHVLNCAKDEIPHDAHEGTFVYEGVRGIRDVSSRENADAFRKTFAKISAFLDSATKSRLSRDVSDDDVAESGGVLVHCFEGKSRSATAAAQHLIRTSRFRSTAAQVMKAIAAKRADARPNAWFAKALEAFANEGARSVDGAFCRLTEPPSRDDADDVAFVLKTRREKPRARRCPKCGAPCGVSALSVQAHVRREHREMYA